MKNYCALLALALAACASSSEQDTRTELVMGATVSRTGVSAVHTWGNSFELAAADASEGLQLAGYPTGKELLFSALIADSRNDAAVTVPRAIELVQEQGALMILNGTSNDSLELNKLAYDDDPNNDLNVPIVCVACSSPSHHNPDPNTDDPVARLAFQNPDDWHFGLSMSSLHQSQVLWNIIRDKTPAGNAAGDINGDGQVKISTIAIDDAFGTGFQDALESVALADNPSVVYEKTTHPKSADVNQYDWVQAVAALTDTATGGTQDVAPDLVIEFTFPNFSLALVKSFSQLGSDLPFLHTHSMRESTVLAAAVDTLEGHEGTSYAPIDGTSGDAFDEHFRNTLSISRQSQWDSHVYDGGFLFSLGALIATRDMENPSAVTGAQIRDAMKQLNDPNGEVIRVGPEEFAKAARAIAEGSPINYEGASGPCDFDDNGRARNRISHWRVDGTGYEQLGLYDCVSGDDCPSML